MSKNIILVYNLILYISTWSNWVGFTWGRRQNPVSETLCFFKKWTRRWIMSKNIILVHNLILYTTLRNAKDAPVGSIAVIKVERHPVLLHHFPPPPQMLTWGEPQQWESCLMYRPEHVIFNKHRIATFCSPYYARECKDDSKPMKNTAVWVENVL
jgi:hypothetical protein